MPAKAKVAFMQLSSCGGCHQSLLNAHLDLLPFLEELDVVYLPAVIDLQQKSLKERSDEEFFVGFLEGVARTKRDTENIKLMRQKCSIIVAIGACSCYGSIAGLANLSDIKDLIKSEFSNAESKTPTKFIPEFEEFIVNIKNLINVDVFIPGCPPTANNIIATILYLLTLSGEGPSSLNKEGCVCDNCDLNTKGCYLNDGKLCYGPLTAAGCKLMCPNNGDYCYGCYKSTNKLGDKTEQLKEILSNITALSPQQAASLQHFLDLYLGVSNIINFYFRGDLLQRLAYEPKSFNSKKVKTKSGDIFALDVAPTGNKILDDIIGTSLYLLKDDPNFKFSSKTVCSHCDREIVDKVPTQLKRDFEGLPTMDTCLLEQGYVCLGLVTQAGCGTLCPNKGNAPCLGCFGPAAGIKDPGVKFISTYGSLCKDKDPEEVKNMFKDPAGLFNRFTLADSTLKHKYNDNMEDK